MEKEKVLTIVRNTREMLMPHWGNIEVLARKDEKPNNVVTKLDHEVEEYLQKELHKLNPDIAFAGEEKGGSRDANRLWLCDPIDGTAHMIRGLPFCSVMLALIEEGKINLSVIYDFVRDEMYHAERGKGAFKNDAPIRVSSRPIEDAYLAWETHDNRDENARITMRLRDRSVLFKSITAGYELALVASGKIEGRVCYDPWGYDWDYAPGALLVEEAGGVVANIGSHEYDYRNLDFIAANPAVYRALTEGADALFPTRQ